MSFFLSFSLGHPQPRYTTPCNFMKRWFVADRSDRALKILKASRTKPNRSWNHSLGEHNRKRDDGSTKQIGFFTDSGEYWANIGDTKLLPATMSNTLLADWVNATCYCSRSAESASTNTSQRESQEWKYEATEQNNELYKSNTELWQGCEKLCKESCNFTPAPPHALQVGGGGGGGWGFGQKCHEKLHSRI